MQVHPCHPSSCARLGADACTVPVRAPCPADITPPPHSSSSLHVLGSQAPSQGLFLLFAQGVIWFSLLSAEKDGDTQSPAGEDQQVSQPPRPVPSAAGAACGLEKVGPPIPPPPLAVPLPARCLRPSRWAAGSLEHRYGSPVPCSCQPQAGDPPAHRVHGGGRSRLRTPRSRLGPHRSRSPPQGTTAESPDHENQKETCHVSPLPLLSAHPAERGEEEGPWQRDGAGGREHTLPRGSNPALHSPVHRPLCRQCPRGWRLGLGTPSLPQRSHLIMHLGALMRSSNEQQRWEGPCRPPGPWAGARTVPRSPRGQLPMSLYHLISCPGPGYHVRGVFYGWNPPHGHLLPGPPSYLPVEDVNHSGRSRAGRAVPWVAPPRPGCP